MNVGDIIKYTQRKIINKPYDTKYAKIRGVYGENFDTFGIIKDIRKKKVYIINLKTTNIDIRRIKDIKQNSKYNI